MDIKDLIQTLNDRKKQNFSKYSRERSFVAKDALEEKPCYCRSSNIDLNKQLFLMNSPPCSLLCMRLGPEKQREIVQELLV